MRYKIIAYIPVETEDYYYTREEAEKEAERLRGIQPENKYEVIEVESESNFT